ncbi:MAG: alpha/beta hydrolase [Gammaproteobacteria bacterium]|nr:alpha/beta hydrolase [Gammaproteobacteria bacterium]
MRCVRCCGLRLFELFTSVSWERNLNVRKDIEFKSAGTKLRGWHSVPKGRGRFPTIVMAHGFSGVKELFLDDFAACFCAAGFAVLVFDHRNFGASEGRPRQEINPWQQIDDYREAISFARTLRQTDKERIGIWGSSYSGGHVLVVGALDRRVKCVVSQVPLISGKATFERLVQGPLMGDLVAALTADREARFVGQAPAKIPVVAPDFTTPCALPCKEGFEFFEKHKARFPSWKNEVTLRSADWGLGYEPGTYVHRISPTPLLMIIASHDTLAPTDVALECYERALEPKKLVIVPGAHFDPYVEKFAIASVAARDWFVAHLQPEVLS